MLLAGKYSDAILVSFSFMSNQLPQAESMGTRAQQNGAKMPVGDISKLAKSLIFSSD